MNPRSRRTKERVYKKGTCCWCGKSPLPPRRSSWCSDACVKEYLAQDPKLLRDRVFDRDHGVCALCRRDTAQISTRLGQRLDPFLAFDSTWPEKKRAMRWHKLLVCLKLARGMCRIRHLWEADHVIPVCWGGPNTLENLRTLCVCCHKKETRALAASRATKRRTDVLVGALVSMMWFNPDVSARSTS